MIDLLLTALAALRLARLITAETGPYRLAERLRTAVYDRYGGSSWQFTGISCPHCVSFWLALALALAPRRLRLGLAAAGLASEWMRWCDGSQS
ncbi:hypothetical protein [Kouleothrix sp.]|uniref:hypothetical protein n=1 Tax=Kouleothrix sp. TaxID=2779161 RepID=UPI00391B35AF